MIDYESVDSIQSSNSPRYSTTYIHIIQGDWQNICWEKRHQYDGIVWPRKIPCPPHQPTPNKSVNFKSRKNDNFWHHDDAKRDHPFGTNGNVQLWHQNLYLKIHQPQYAVNMKGFKTGIKQKATDSINHHRKRGIYQGGEQHLLRATPTTRRSSWNNTVIIGNCTQNAEPNLWDGSTDTGQLSPNKLQLCSDGTIGATHHSHLCDTVTAQYPIFVINNNNQTEILLLELQ